MATELLNPPAEEAQSAAANLRTVNPRKPSSFRRTRTAFQRRWREFRMIVKGSSSTDHPVQAQIIPMRRCNLACAYCNEFDDFSSPVPRAEMFRRIDHVAA